MAGGRRHVLHAHVLESCDQLFFLLPAGTQVQESGEAAHSLLAYGEKQRAADERVQAAHRVHAEQRRQARPCRQGPQPRQTPQLIEGIQRKPAIG